MEAPTSPLPPRSDHSLEWLGSIISSLKDTPVSKPVFTLTSGVREPQCEPFV